jgi:serine/threonine protein kinase
MERKLRLTTDDHSMTRLQDQLSLATIRRIDERCDQFEQECRAGQAADLGAFLDGWLGQERWALVSELVAIDRHYARLRGTSRDAADYVAQLPDDGPAIEEAFQKDTFLVDGRALEDSDGKTGSTGREDTFVQSARAAIPHSIGRYRVLRKLGVGSFGVVFLAYDPELNRQVAIKCPKSGDWTTDSRWQLFYHEAELAAKLRHPGVVAIHDIGRDESGGPYFVMEYIAGEPLKDRLARGLIDPNDAIELACELAQALDSIHKAGLVHRDLKPANVLLDEAGNPHIADLGLALDTNRSSEDELAGTFAYMAPEQLPLERPAHERSALDHRCDIWAVGVILYEMLVGRRPFEGGSRAELFRQINHDAPPLPVDARVHPSVVQICKKCLAKKPDSRYASAAALADAIRQARNGSSRTWSRKRLSTIAACVLVVLAAVPTIYLLRSSNTPTPDYSALASAADQVAAAPDPIQFPFVVSGTGERFAELYAAVDAAADGEVIEIDADGPMSIDQLNLDQRRLTIRAALGRRPVITLADESRLFLLHTAGDLTLEGLDLRRGTPSSRATRNVPSVVAVEEPGKLQVKRCRFAFESSTKNRGPCIRAAQCNCSIQDTELYHQNGAAITWIPDDGVKLTFDNCVAGVENLAVVRGDGRTPANVEVRRCTVRAKHVFISLGVLRTPVEAKVTLKAERCYFDVDAVIIQIIPFPEGAPQTLDAVTNTITWEGNQNVFAVRDTYVRSTFAGELKSLSVGDLAAWNKLWGTEMDSIEIAAVENRGGPESVDYSIPISGRPDWVARVDGRQIGFVAGADIDSVGP